MKIINAPLTSNVSGTHREPYRRVVAVQGAVQLTSALAAIRLSTRTKGTLHAENHLIVHDLSSPEGQAGDFAACLMDLATKAEKWATLHYFPMSEMLRFQKSMKEGGWDSAIQTLQTTLKFDRCDELLLGQNLLFVNNLLHRSFPDAETACYGDGIGLNFSDDYYRPLAEESSERVSLGRAIERWVRRRIKSLRGIPPTAPIDSTKSKKHAVPFDKHYLLLANQFDQNICEFEQLQAADYRDLFSIFAKDLDHRAVVTSSALKTALKDACQVIVLLTSNFSETKRMSLAGEIRCCMQMVRRAQTKQRAMLVIKPHPRDSIEKIRCIEREASKLFAHVVTLADPWTFFVPFESIFEHFFSSIPSVASKTKVVCSSSACIGLEFLYGQRCELGFGQRQVRRHFATKWQSLRERHESDLHRLTQRVREMRSKRDAA